MEAEVEKLSESLVNELVGALGLPKSRALHALFWRLFRRLTDHFADIGVSFDRTLSKSGLPQASQDLLMNFCSGINSRGSENIPPQGPLLIASNHPGAYDALILFSQANRKDLCWVSSEIPFLEMLPHTRLHIFFASRKDAYNRMAVMRKSIRHLQGGGSLMYFAAGHRDPDPAVFPGAANLMDAWIAGVDFFFRHVPDLQLVPTVISGVVSKKWAEHPITWLRRKQIDKHRLAEFGQVISQLWLPGRLMLNPNISFGQPVNESQLRDGPNGDNLLPAVIQREKALLLDHCKTFGGCVNEDDKGRTYGPRDYQVE